MLLAAEISDIFLNILRGGKIWTLHGQIKEALDVKVVFGGAVLPICAFQRVRLGLLFALSAARCSC